MDTALSRFGPLKPHLARNLNYRWDHPRAAKRLARLGISLNKKVGQLSGGQKAPVSAALGAPPALRWRWRG